MTNPHRTFSCSWHLCGKPAICDFYASRYRLRYCIAHCGLHRQSLGDATPCPRCFPSESQPNASETGRDSDFTKLSCRFEDSVNFQSSPDCYFPKPPDSRTLTNPSRFFADQADEDAKGNGVVGKNEDDGTKEQDEHTPACVVSPPLHARSAQPTNFGKRQDEPILPPFQSGHPTLYADGQARYKIRNNAEAHRRPRVRQLGVNMPPPFSARASSTGTPTSHPQSDPAPGLVKPHVKPEAEAYKPVNITQHNPPHLSGPRVTVYEPIGRRQDLNWTGSSHASSYKQQGLARREAAEVHNPSSGMRLSHGESPSTSVPNFLQREQPGPNCAPRSTVRQAWRAGNPQACIRSRPEVCEINTAPVGALAHAPQSRYPAPPLRLGSSRILPAIRQPSFPGHSNNATPASPRPTVYYPGATYPVTPSGRHRETPSTSQFQPLVMVQQTRSMVHSVDRRHPPHAPSSSFPDSSVNKPLTAQSVQNNQTGLPSKAAPTPRIPDPRKSVDSYLATLHNLSAEGDSFTLAPDVAACPTHTAVSIAAASLHKQPLVNIDSGSGHGRPVSSGQSNAERYQPVVSYRIHADSFSEAKSLSPPQSEHENTCMVTHDSITGDSSPRETLVDLIDGPASDTSLPSSATTLGPDDDDLTRWGLGKTEPTPTLLYPDTDGSFSEGESLSPPTSERGNSPTVTDDGISSDPPSRKPYVSIFGGPGLDNPWPPSPASTPGPGDEDRKCSPLKAVFTSPTALQPGCREFFAVYRGRIPGVYGTRDELGTQVHGLQNALFRRFDNLWEAQMYLLGKD